MTNVHNVRVSIDTARADMTSRRAQRERVRVAITDPKYPSAPLRPPRRTVG
jgi:hypothetical protein